MCSVRSLVTLTKTIRALSVSPTSFRCIRSSCFIFAVRSSCKCSTTVLTRRPTIGWLLREKFATCAFYCCVSDLVYREDNYLVKSSVCINLILVHIENWYNYENLFCRTLQITLIVTSNDSTSMVYSTWNCKHLTHFYYFQCHWTIFVLFLDFYTHTRTHTHMHYLNSYFSGAFRLHSFPLVPVGDWLKNCVVESLKSPLLIQWLTPVRDVPSINILATDLTEPIIKGACSFM